MKGMSSKTAPRLRKAVLSLVAAFTGATLMDAACREAFNDRGRMTPAEIEEARVIFGEAIDYSKVEIVTGKISFLQSPRRALTLGNRIYLPEHENHDPHARHHELAHVWQNQTGLPECGLSAGFRLFATTLYRDHVYDYKTDPGRALTDYSFEQQAQIVQDYSSARSALMDLEKTRLKNINDIRAQGDAIRNGLKSHNIACADLETASDKYLRRAYEQFCAVQARPYEERAAQLLPIIRKNIAGPEKPALFAFQETGKRPR